MTLVAKGFGLGGGGGDGPGGVDIVIVAIESEISDTQLSSNINAPVVTAVIEGDQIKATTVEF